MLPWYPDRMAYQLNLTRKDIRREEIYFKLHNFLVQESGTGNNHDLCCVESSSLAVTVSGRWG